MKRIAVEPKLPLNCFMKLLSGMFPKDASATSVIPNNLRPFACRVRISIDPVLGIKEPQPVRLRLPIGEVVGLSSRKLFYRDGAGIRNWGIDPQCSTALVCGLGFDHAGVTIYVDGWTGLVSWRDRVDGFSPVFGAVRRLNLPWREDYRQFAEQILKERP